MPERNLADWQYWHTTWPAQRLILSRVNQADSYPRAVTPLTQDLVLRYVDAGIRQYLVQSLGAMTSSDAPMPYMWAVWGYIYVDADLMAGIGEALPGSSRQLIYEQYMGLKPDPTFKPPHRPLRSRLKELRLAWPVLSGMWRSVRSAESRFEQQMTGLRDLRPQVAEPDLRECLAWLARIESELPGAVESLMIGAAAASATFDVCAKVLAAITRAPAADLTNRLHSGLGGNESAEAALLVARLATHIRANSALAEAINGQADMDAAAVADPEFVRDFEQGLARFGYQTAPALELAQPTWRQDPGQLLQIVIRKAQGDAADDQRAARVRDSAEAALRELVPGRKRFFVEQVLELSRRQMALRENGKGPYLLAFDEIRRMLEVAGPILVSRGKIARPTDPLYLTLDELRAVLAGAEAPHPIEIDRRISEHEACLTLDLPELIELGPGYTGPVSERDITDRGLIPPAPVSPDVACLSGVGVSAGRVAGPARVMLDPSDDFEPGEILIARNTDPGWSGALSCAAAVVLDVGGNLSHGAVVSRELGIPCVVNVKAATNIITNGTVITVDGSTGEVLIDGSPRKASDG